MVIYIGNVGELVNTFNANYQSVIFFLFCGTTLMAEGLRLDENIMYLGFHSHAGTHAYLDTHKPIDPPKPIGTTAAARPVEPAAGSVATASDIKHDNTVEISIYMMNKDKTLVGTITAKDTIYGLMLRPKLFGLTPQLTAGIHGFHIHENGSCDEMAMDAGGHLDPFKTKVHLGPFNPKGHLGDLPALYLDKDGTISHPVMAPKLRVNDILGASIIIHANGDNYSDHPELAGGGGSRSLCGVIPKHTGY